MKKLVLMLLCVGFANFAMANESPNLQIPADANTTLTTQFENIKTLEFPKDEKEEKELNELFKAIETLDSDKIKALVKKNPNLVNLQNSQDERPFAPIYEAVLTYGEATNDKAREVALKNIKILLDNKADVNIYSHIKDNNTKISLFSLLVILDIPLDRKFEIIHFLIKHGNLDIHQTALETENKALSKPNIINALMDIPDSYHKFELFKFFVDKKLNINGVLLDNIGYSHGKKIKKLIEDNNIEEINLYINSQEYQKDYRDIVKKYFQYIFENYSVNSTYFNSKIGTAELQITSEYFIYTNDIEFIQLMIDNGYLKNEKLYEFMLKTAQKIDATKIINILKGTKDGSIRH